MTSTFRPGRSLFGLTSEQVFSSEDEEEVSNGAQKQTRLHWAQAVLELI